MVGFTATLFRTGSDQLGGFSLAHSGQPSSPIWASWQWSALTVNCLAASALTCSSRRCSFCPGFLGSASQPRLVVLAGTSLAVSDAQMWLAVARLADSPLRTGSAALQLLLCRQWSRLLLRLCVRALIGLAVSAFACSRLLGGLSSSFRQ